MRFVNKTLLQLRLAGGVAMALASVMTVAPARAEGFTDYEVTTGLVCDTPQQVERFLALFDGNDAGRAIKTVNAEANDPSACAESSFAYLRGREAGTIHDGNYAYTIVHVLVLGIVTDGGVRPIRPAAYFTVFAAREYGV